MTKGRHFFALLLVFFMIITSTINFKAVSAKAATTLPAPTLSFYPMTPTNGNVTITVYYPKGAVNKQYRLNLNGYWLTYTAPVVLTSNAHFYCRYQNSSGVWSTLGGYPITNIDNIPPSNPSFNASTSEPANQDITVSVSFSSDSTLKQYRIGGSTSWTDYTEPVILCSNNTIEAKASDSVGNWSSIASYTVDNIDKTPPAAPVLTTNSTSATNGIVNVSIVYSDDAIIKQYLVEPSETWTNYSDPFDISSNTTIHAKAQDAAGNWSTEEVLTIGNIDKVAPQAPTFTASNTMPTNQEVSVTINYSNDSEVKQYRHGSADTWSSYTEPVVLDSNNTIYAKAQDSAGNWSDEACYSVTNIDVTPPEKPTFFASTSALTDQPVILSISYSQDSETKQYKIGSSGVWTNYSTPIALTYNSTIYAKSCDAVGNWSIEESYDVMNIRKTVLGYTVKTYSTDTASYNSMAANTAVLNEIATATYSVDGSGNLTGTAPTDQINYANNNGIRPKLMVSNNFNSAIAEQLLETPANRETLKNSILDVLTSYNYQGVDIDIENIPAANRNDLTALMSEIYSALKPLGYEVSIAVQAKTYDSPYAAWNYAFDYKSLAMYSDFLMLMAYDEHYPGGTAGSIASIDWVTNVVNYALTVVPKEKIILGMAAYGYDWVGTTTKSLSVNNCYNLAKQYSAAINLDNTTKSKYFTYSVNNVSHTVWFEDGETIAYKLDLANSRELKGVGIWRLGLENSDYWSTIKSKLNK